jgi:hypothetical protein
MDYAACFDSKYVKAHELNGKDTVVTITSAVPGVVQNKGGQAKKIICTVAEFEKPIVFNVTNANRIGKLYGRPIEGWVGKQITLYEGETDTEGGDVVPCIRVRPAVPVVSGPKLAETA